MAALNIKALTKNIGWVLLEILVFAIISVALIFIVSLLLAALGLQDTNTSLSEDFSHPYKMLWTEYLPLLIIFTTVTYLTHTAIFKFPFRQTGINASGILREFSWGWTIGTALVSIGFLLLLLFKGIDFRGLNWNTALFFGFFLFFLIQSAGEEVLIRGFLLPVVEQRLGTITALLTSSSLFAIAHYFNPNASWIGLANIFLGGLLMGILFIQFRNIWASIGLHASWNFVQASFFDFEVSGFDVYSFVQFDDIGSDVFTGGDFGYEGSIIAVVLLAITISTMLLKTDNVSNLWVKSEA